ncbi:carbon-nitrogen hydrolase, partial [Francisellaceae bacterium]|nr:carbon-nitrogen hydrolase [Francisellaceae bacterium]
MTKLLKIALILFVLFETGYTKNIVTISAIQMSSTQQTYQQFADTVKKLAKQAKSEGADIIVFPEDNSLNMINDSDFTLNDLKSLSKHVKPFSAHISQLSKELNVILVGGTIPYIREDKLYNTAIIGLPDGKVIYHDKIYLTPWEVKIGYNGSGNNISVFNTKWG